MLHCTALLLAAVVPFSYGLEELQGRWSSTRVRLGEEGREVGVEHTTLSTTPHVQAPSSGGWPTEHQNVLNSGSTEFVGPGSSAGDCVVPFFNFPPTTPVRFYSSGVTSATPGVNAHFFGGSDNIARVVVNYGTVTSPSTVTTSVNVTACNLTSLNVASPATIAASPFGLVAGATTWTAGDGVTDRVAFASSDGVVYALNWQSCVAQNQTLCSSSSYVITPASFGSSSTTSSSSSASSGSPGVDAPPCVAWTFKSPMGFPFLTPPRYISPQTGGGNLVIVSDTAPGLVYTGATTYALNSETGALVWNHTHNVYNGASYGSVGAPPAFDVQDDILFVVYGPGVVALEPAAGKTLGFWNGTGDNVVASPSVFVGDFGSSYSVYLHTELGTLWSLEVSQNAATKAVTFQPNWKCDYTLAAWYATGKGVCTPFSASLAFPGVESEVVEVPLLGQPAPQLDTSYPPHAPTTATFSATRGEFSGGGGWYQPTTRTQRAHLWAAIRARYAAAFPTGPTTLLTQSQLDILASTHSDTPEALDMLEVALMSSALPLADKEALYKGVDWAQDPNPSVSGFALFSGGTAAASSGGDAPLGAGEYVSNYPLATPTQVSSGELALAQFSPLTGNNAGLFAVKTLDGSIVWAYSNTTVFGTTIKFGRSRSSPTSDGLGYLYGASVSRLLLEPLCVAHTLSSISHPTPPPFFSPLPKPSPVGSDSDYFVNDTLPYILAFQKVGASYTLQWISNLGEAQVNTLGSASPVVRSGLTNREPELYSASFQGAVALVAGKNCPTYLGLECGASGVCNCATGACSCPKAACFQGKGCGDTCNDHGVCKVVSDGANGTAAQCTCAACWSGPTCDIPTCGGGAAAKPFLSTPTGAAAVGVPVTLALLALLGVAWWRVSHPKAPWSSMLPSWLVCGGGGGAGSVYKGTEATPRVDEESSGFGGSPTKIKGYGLVPQSIPGTVETAM
jgi:hypothetical protein